MANHSAIALAPTAASCSIQLTKTAKTTNLERDYGDLSAKGIVFLSKPKTLPGTSVSIVCFKDPDGTFIELLEGDF